MSVRLSRTLAAVLVVAVGLLAWAAWAQVTLRADLRRVLVELGGGGVTVGLADLTWVRAAHVAAVALLVLVAAVCAVRRRAGAATFVGLALVATLSALMLSPFSGWGAWAFSGSANADSFAFPSLDVAVALWMVGAVLALGAAVVLARTTPAKVDA